MKRISRLFALLLPMLAFSVMAFAQEDAKTDFGNTMRSNGRIYVVIAVILTILIGLFIYLIRIDRKISKLENNRQ